MFLGLNYRDRGGVLIMFVIVGKWVINEENIVLVNLYLWVSLGDL